LENEALDFAWKQYPQAEVFLTELLSQYIQDMPCVAAFQEEMRVQTGTQLGDWLDHIVVADGPALRERLEGWGFHLSGTARQEEDTVYGHSGAVFPYILLRQDSSAPAETLLGAAIHVESVSRFLMTHGICAPVEGDPLSPLRFATAWQADGRIGREFLILERRSCGGFDPVWTSPGDLRGYFGALESWSTRPRTFPDIEEGLNSTLALARTLVDKLGPAMASWIVFEAERAYWQSRNWAGMIQKARQDSLGLGWGNHDHHTFRSSRGAFEGLIRILETLGFQARERFYAGAQAGWGAQVMDQPECGLTVFADVDLAPEELAGDFSHMRLEPRQQLGTVGLWCALHGESILDAGMHHLAGRMNPEPAVEQLARKGIPTMPPFSAFPHLWQAFTQGEQWKVREDSLVRLEYSGIARDQVNRFRDEGALGSHLEIIRRRDGYKGFNQQGVSDIIRRTDPRISSGEIFA
jgi:hypothetical protein